MSGKMIQYNILKREAEANKALYDSLQTKLKEAADFFRPEILQYSNCGSSHDSFDTLAASQDQEYCPGVSRRLGGRHWTSASSRVSGQHGEEPGRCRDLDRPAFSWRLCLLFADGDAATRAGFFKTASIMVTRNELSWWLSTCPNRRCRRPSAPFAQRCCSRRPDRPPQVILVTSALPREGKTTAAANLAVTLAQLGDKTVLVDADLRKPGVGRLLNLGTAKYPGLSSYLAGVSTLDVVTVPHPVIPNLAAIPTGPLPPNPADLLSSHKTGRGHRRIAEEVQIRGD